MVLIDFIIPTLVFGAFSLIAVVGAFLIVRRFRGTGAAVMAAASTLVFFSLLFAGVVALVRTAGG